MPWHGLPKGMVSWRLMSENEAARLPGEGGETNAHPSVVPDEVLQAMPPEMRQATVTALARMSSGPLPQADEFAKYENAVPGAGDRILAMAEREQAHRHEKENKAMDYTARDVGRGAWMGMAVSLSFVALAAYGMWLGVTGPTLVFGGVGAAGVLSSAWMLLRSSRTQPPDEP